MKTISNLFGMTLVLMTTLTANAADFETKERLINEYDINTELVLNEENVRCSVIGYNLPELKISVPDLAFYTFFSHANFGELQPCMTAGACQVGRMPGDLIAPDKINEQVSIHIKLVEKYYIDHLAKNCTRELIETLATNVRGLPFKHLKSGYLGDFPYETCKAL